IANNSGIAQNFATAVDGSGHTSKIYFSNSATAGSGNIFTNVAGFGLFGSSGAEVFFDNSTAGDATFINTGGAFGGAVFFLDDATAGNATVTNEHGNGY